MLCEVYMDGHRGQLPCGMSQVNLDFLVEYLSIAGKTC